MDNVIGVAVDAVSDILNSSKSGIMPPPQLHQPERDAVVQGLISMQDRMIIILDVEHLFDEISLHAVA